MIPIFCPLDATHRRRHAALTRSPFYDLTMKTAGAIALVTLGCANAFVVPAGRTVVRAETARAAEKINTIEFELDKPKASQASSGVVTMDSVDAGGKKVYCRCWKSGTFPLCDGAHVKHNEATGDNVGPLIVSGPKKE
ncbi:unnamed protein product [Ectocarpus sp. 6 AP-2014]